MTKFSKWFLKNWLLIWGAGCVIVAVLNGVENEWIGLAIWLVLAALFLGDYIARRLVSKPTGGTLPPVQSKTFGDVKVILSKGYEPVETPSDEPKHEIGVRMEDCPGCQYNSKK